VKSLVGMIVRKSSWRCTTCEQVFMQRSRTVSIWKTWVQNPKINALTPHCGETLDDGKTLENDNGDMKWNKHEMPSVSCYTGVHRDSWFKYVNLPFFLYSIIPFRATKLGMALKVRCKSCRRAVSVCGYRSRIDHNSAIKCCNCR